MADDAWYIRDRNKIAGPFTMAHLESLRKRGQLASFHQISQDRQNWVSAASLNPVAPPVPVADSPKTYPTVSEPPEVKPSEPAASAPARSIASTPAQNELLPSFVKFFDLKLSRYYTIPIAKLLWMLYLAIAALTLSLYLFSFVLPNAAQGIVNDLSQIFANPFPTMGSSESRFAMRLIALILMTLWLIFLGLHVRVFLELLSVPFHIANHLKDLKKNSAIAKGQRPPGD